MFKSLVGLVAFALMLSASPCVMAADSDLPPTRSATHSLPVDTPASPDAPPHESVYRGGTDRDNEAALVFETQNGDRLASSDVNRITCRACATDSAGKEVGAEWLGTQMGIKAIDRAGDRVVHYTQIDGLPGDYVEAIVATTTRIYCLVRIASPAKLSLCTLELGSSSAHWQTLATIDATVRTPQESGNSEKRNALDNAWCQRWGLSHPP